jgi:rhodanese-related sulfurtransferase
MILSEATNLKKLFKDDAGFVLIDLRDPAEAARAHIPAAVSVPSAMIGSAAFPADKGAPIILYDASGVDVEAFKAVRKMGYKNLSVLLGGLSAWQSAGGQVVSGQLAAAIKYVKKTPRGQISVDDFMALLKSPLPGIAILDVRDAATAAGGMLPGAINIPSEELEARIGELPAGKEIIVHCNTGVLASGAVEVLKKHGFKTRFVDAIVQVSEDGTYEVTEK